MSSQALNPYYFVGDIHNAVLDYIKTHITSNPELKDLANLVYDGLVDYKASNSDFISVDLGMKVIVAEAVNDVFNPVPNSPIQHPIGQFFPDLFDAIVDPFTNHTEVATLANSKIIQVRDSDLDLTNKISIYGGLAIYPSSASYWNTVRTTPGDAWFTYIEGETAVGNVPDIVGKSIIRADAEAFLAGTLGHATSNVIAGKGFNPLESLAYGVGAGVGYSLGKLIWRIFGFEVSE